MNYLILKSNSAEGNRAAGSELSGCSLGPGAAATPAVQRSQSFLLSVTALSVRKRPGPLSATTFRSPCIRDGIIVSTATPPRGHCPPDLGASLELGFLSPELPRHGYSCASGRSGAGISLHMGLQVWWWSHLPSELCCLHWECFRH